MSKYSKEFKIEVIKYYKEGNGLPATAKHFNIPTVYGFWGHEPKSTFLTLHNFKNKSRSII